VPKALLTERREEKVSQDQASGENTPGPVGPVVETGRWPVDTASWFSICFFVYNIVGCLLWYTVKYNSTGTENPSWTDIFG